MISLRQGIVLPGLGQVRGELPMTRPGARHLARALGRGLMPGVEGYGTRVLDQELCINSYLGWDRYGVSWR